ncbi:MAG: hypothetical protein JNM83_23890 [Myxococcales bacterium]|jgi:hypothetical protein|nr:hypothetical protein [Myxococcales bacterium]
MKKFLVLAVLLIAGGAYAGYYVAPDKMPLIIRPESRACSRFTSLCEEKASQECSNYFSELRKLGGDESIRKPIRCVMDAQSCGEAAGCLAGGGVNAVMKSGEQFFKGLGKSLGE